MAKFHGKLGFIQTKETAPGVFSEIIEERDYTGDVLRDNQRWEKGEKVNDDLNISNRYSILADPYLYENFNRIRYLVLNGSKWKINTLEFSRPRIILNLGGLYNG